MRNNSDRKRKAEDNKYATALLNLLRYCFVLLPVDNDRPEQRMLMQPAMKSGATAEKTRTGQQNKGRGGKKRKYDTQDTQANAQHTNNIEYSMSNIDGEPHLTIVRATWSKAW